MAGLSEEEKELFETVRIYLERDRLSWDGLSALRVDWRRWLESAKSATKVLKLYLDRGQEIPSETYENYINRLDGDIEKLWDILMILGDPKGKGVEDLGEGELVGVCHMDPQVCWVWMKVPPGAAKKLTVKMKLQCPSTGTQWSIVDFTYVPGAIVEQGAVGMILEKSGEGPDLQIGDHLILDPYLYGRES
jgi:hypothetical protein